MQNLELSDGSKKDMGKKDCLVARVCQGAYVETEFIPDGRRIGSFQASFCDPSECSNYRSEKNVQND